MNARTLKTAISSIVYVIEEDIRQLNVWDPDIPEAYNPAAAESTIQIADSIIDGMNAVKDMMAEHKRSCIFAAELCKTVNDTKRAKQEAAERAEVTPDE